MSEGIKERISALVDGELSEFESRRVLEELEEKPELRDYWKKLQITKLGLKEESLGYLGRDISKRVARELGEHAYETVNSKKISGFNLSMVAAVSACLVLVLSFGIFNSSENLLSTEELFASQASKKIEQAIASPQAMQVLDRALTGMNVTLEDLNSGKKGQVYANYRFSSNGKTFSVSLSPVSLGTPELRNTQAPKLAYLKTDSGVFIFSVSGNISSEQKSQILRNANFTVNQLR
tara:strand:- start:222 stop:929 length:708 start_codon:yes stop_codon:yes gene_type:complete